MHNIDHPKITYRRETDLLVQQLALAHQKPARDLRGAGWARFSLSDLPFPPWLHADFASFARNASRNLPDDPHDRSRTRKRRYGLFLWLPSNQQILPAARELHHNRREPRTPYLQGEEYQPEFGGQVRRFTGLSEWCLASPVMRSLIEADGCIALSSGVLPPAAAYFVGVHIISLQPRPDTAAVITPDEIHCDGEPVTFVHLLARTNVTGGWNAVTDPSCVGSHPEQVQSALVFGRFSLELPGDGFVVDDRRVAHYVHGVSRTDATAPGCRTVLLIDFCPARRVLSKEL